MNIQEKIDKYLGEKKESEMYGEGHYEFDQSDFDKIFKKFKKFSTETKDEIEIWINNMLTTLEKVPYKDWRNVTKTWKKIGGESMMNNQWLDDEEKQILKKNVISFIKSQ